MQLISNLIECGCVLRRVVRDATAAFLTVLDGYTLADLIEPHNALSALLLDPPLAANA